MNKKFKKDSDKSLYTKKELKKIKEFKKLLKTFGLKYEQKDFNSVMIGTDTLLPIRKIVKPKKINIGFVQDR